MNRPRKPLAALLAAMLFLQGLPVLAADDTPPPPAAAPQAPTFTQEEIDQLVAPIALYPDALLAQVLMASTYPLEIVAAARWQKEHASLKDKALEDALLQQTWDPSVKSLTAFPPVLTMLNDKLDWTQKLGDAFLAQQSDVMDAVQRLRAMANAAGNLASNEQQKVTVQPAPVQQNVTVQGQAAPPPQVIVIEPAQPQIVYVPTYNPAVAYGTWPYPAPPPYSYYPPGYAATTSILSFGVGMAVGASLWGGCSWGGYGGHNDVDIDINRYNNFNHTNISNKNWEHNVEHRKGVQYRDGATQQKYKKGGDTRAAQSREEFRGRADQGRQDLDRGAAKDFKNKPAAATERKSQPAARDVKNKPAAAASRSARQPAANRAPDKAQRASAPARASSREGAGAFQGAGDGKQARADANRGKASRESATVARSGGGGKPGGGGGGHASGAGSKGGGGGSRSGGGRGGGKR